MIVLSNQGFLVHKANGTTQVIIPSKKGCSSLMSEMILTGLKIDHNKHCKVEFGTYKHIHE